MLLMKNWEHEEEPNQLNQTLGIYSPEHFDKDAKEKLVGAKGIRLQGSVFAKHISIY